MYTSKIEAQTIIPKSQYIILTTHYHRQDLNRINHSTLTNSAQLRISELNNEILNGIRHA